MTLLPESGLKFFQPHWKRSRFSRSADKLRPWDLGMNRSGLVLNNDLNSRHQELHRRRPAYLLSNRARSSRPFRVGWAIHRMAFGGGLSSLAWQSSPRRRKCST